MNEFQRHLTFPGQRESVQFSIDSPIKLMYSGSNTAAVVNEAGGSFTEVETQGRIN